MTAAALLPAGGPDAIIAAGFIVGNVTMIPNCRLTFGGVLSQNPGPGPALRGTAVNLTESNGKQSNGKPCNIQ